MQWWNDLWLNEGFATFMEQDAVNHLFPEWDMWAQFVASSSAAAKELDALDSTHALRPQPGEVANTAIINAQFDVISYEKGGSVIRMLANLLGYELIFAGLSRYLKVRSQGNGWWLWELCTTQASPITSYSCSNELRTSFLS